MTIPLGVLVTLLGLLCTSVGVIIGYKNYQHTTKKDAANKASNDGELKSDINYIKRGVEDIRVDLKAQEMRFGELSERVARVEESTKSAHRRIDEVTTKNKGASINE